MADNSKDTKKTTAGKTASKATADKAATGSSKAKATDKATAAKATDKTSKANAASAKSAPAKATADKSAKAAPAKASADKKTTATAKTSAKDTAAKKEVKPAAKSVKEEKPAKVDSKKTDSKATKATAANAAVASKSAAADSKSAKKAEPIKETKSAKKEESTKETKSAKKEEKPAKKEKAEKSSAKAKSSKSAKSGEASGRAAVAAAVWHDPSKRNMIIIASAIVLVLLLTIIIISVVAVNNHRIVTVNPYKNMSRAGYAATTLETNVERYKPVDGMSNEGLNEYPTYGYTLSSVLGTSSDKVAARDALIAESSYLTATGTANAGGGGYTWMDKDGYLFKGTVAEPEKVLKNGKQRQLYMHTAAVGMYLGDKNDPSFANEKAVTKQITMMPRGYSSYGVTGLYAPAGEVIKVTMSEDDMKATGGIVIHIGQALYNGQANNIWTAKNQMQRMPHLLNTLQMTTNTMEYDEDTHTYTGYIGSFIGGPIYIRNESATFTVTISGGLTYSHFILGYTTPEEFEKNKDSSVPYFDLEVWEFGCLHSGPKAYAAAFDYDQLYNAAVLWEKVSLATTSRGNGYYQGIVFLYDPFVAAGAAVAFPGRSSVNCPMGWMSSSLNYQSIIAAGSWGNFHEYHHNFQGFGVGSDGEVTNNSLNLVSYSLFTKISSSRSVGSYGAAGLSGWNTYTTATWTLERVIQNQISSTNGLAVYATLLHNFGPEAYLKNAKGSGNTFWANWSDYTHEDMSYYVSMVSSFATSSSVSTVHSYAENKGYTSMFVPMASVYQTGRSYMVDGEKVYFDSMQPYVITYGEDFTVDLSPYTVDAASGQYLSGSVVMPNGFSYKIKEVKADGISGKFTATDDPYVFNFTPGKELYSGKIYVTLEVTNESATVNGVKFNVDDIDLVLEFEQSHESNKAILERTTYTYEQGKAYTDAVTAWDKNFAGYKSVNEGNNINPTQNSNTDIWYYPAVEAYKDSEYVVPLNSVAVVSGKLYIEEAGKYRIVMRGRNNCALYLKYGDDQDYKLAAKIQDKITQSNAITFRLKDSAGNNTYTDIEVKEDKSWVYFKLVLVTYTAEKNASFIGLGIAQWSVPLYTTTEDDDGVTHYWYNGKEVSAEEASNVEPIMPTTISYASAYRPDYEFPKEFTSDYYLIRHSAYTYTEQSNSTMQKLLEYDNFQPLNGDEENNGIANLFTDKHYASNARRTISEATPFTMLVDCQKTISANSLTITGTHGATMGDFLLYVGNTPNVDDMECVEITPVVSGTTSVTATFEHRQFRYYYLYVMNTIDGNGGRNGNYLVITSLTFKYVVDGIGYVYSPDDDMFTYRGVGKWSLKSVISNYGHVYYGKNKATLEFEFEGSRMGILSSSAYGHNFEVTIDGKKITPISLMPEGDTIMAFMTPLLSSTKHKVKVVCKGKANIDSFVLYPMIEEEE